MTVSQNYRCSAVSPLHTFWAILPQKAVIPVHPHPTCFLGTLVLYWFKQSQRAHLIFSMQKAVDTTGSETWYEIPKNLLGVTVPSHKLSASGQLPRL